ncbi:hypothetical protein C9J27_05595 [Photobacterium kishitanii]|uniref:Uncharacterized protein n=1 Tax=Photobacterium kishitanii TaxID=318456 RepID=A0A2T3KLS7_9GAMM|nr:hypothetical protein C9J27_05595 [Photobacterium kishitanii]
MKCAALDKAFFKSSSERDFYYNICVSFLDGNITQNQILCRLPNTAKKVAEKEADELISVLSKNIGTPEVFKHVISYIIEKIAAVIVLTETCLLLTSLILITAIFKISKKETYTRDQRRILNQKLVYSLNH